jgi:hypothetical protein
VKPAIWFALLTLFSTACLGQTAPKKPVKRPSTRTATAAEVEALRDALTAQQQLMERQQQQMEELKSQLQQLLQANTQGTTAAQQAQDTAEKAQSTATQAQQAASAAQETATKASSLSSETKAALAVVDTKTKDDGKKLAALESLTGRIRFTGDVRVRGENLMQDCPTCSTRNRGRVRVRFGVDGKISDDFTGGFMLTSGSLGDSNSTNESLTNFFTRKAIAIDRAYVTYHPSAYKWLSLTGGKFAYTWQRSSLTFDPDINPEGFSERLSFDLKSPVLKSFSVQGIQLLFNEVNRGADSFAAGGQVSGRLEFGRLSTTPSFTLLNWRGVDALLNASAFSVQATSTTGGLPVPGEGPGCAPGSGLPMVPPCVYSPQSFTNATFTDTNGRVHFLSQFLYADLILNNRIKTAWEKLPLNFVLEYHNNLNAAEHPLDAQGNVLTNLGKQSHAYGVDLSLGANLITDRNAPGKFQFGYAWWRQEQDSILASFGESEQRAPTNILQNRIYANYRLRPNTVASVNYWVGRTLNSALQHSLLAPGLTSGELEPYIKRLQLDIIYAF